MQECLTQSTPMAMMVMIVSHLVTMAKAKSKGLGIHNEFETTIKRVRSDNDSELELMSYVMNLE